MLGPLVELLEVVGRVHGFAGRLEAEPGDIRSDGFGVVFGLAGGVGVVETQPAGAAQFGGDPEVEAYGLGVADVEVAVGFGRETGLDSAPEGADAVIPADQVAYVVAGHCRASPRYEARRSGWASRFSAVSSSTTRPV